MGESNKAKIVQKQIKISFLLYLTKELAMKDGVDNAEHLLDESFMCLWDTGSGCMLASILQLVLHFVQQLTQELLSILLSIAPECWDQLPH